MIKNLFSDRGNTGFPKQLAKCVVTIKKSNDQLHNNNLRFTIIESEHY